ncbi:Nucleoside-diphosphate-sugar epimerase [Actinopolymorpha cephalotaxi]|uniref:Nucleoside-diphosphate-sugar epimerase n=1 Tax=Actinopolymorpha cephalotaxi TaxID=504797 RepID=A0A1I2VBU8_9ACTN|nr:NAD-dependent epimerase/dehydratase family protein [Actinopolymorpha cephalotaxi]NYH84818.1 nucleoside-diphosphate-sugar epimerase [Actinopolymorpha cephalotaxi]SFG86553.1 Nucleoside-diphosphate-sugar epimerase [Actinopolymorpha cephalotaxi]
MRILVLGGTVFLSAAVAAEAVARGHEVTCAARGTSGEPPAGTSFVRVDRDDPDGLAPLAGREFDAVVDVARLPSQVARAVAALGDGVRHWTFVSSISVYTDNSTPKQNPHTGPVHDPLPDDADEGDVANYGPAKVSCEQAVLASLGDRANVVRAGLIVGPGDRSDRFTYWPVRLARGGEVLAPGAPDEPVQVIDVRDLAAWIVRSAETGVVGVFDATAPAVGRGEFLDRVAAGVADAMMKAGADVDSVAGADTEPKLTWVDQEFLTAQKVDPWAGPRSLPVWLPLPEYAGMLDHDVSETLAAGLAVRDLAQTARDTLTWALETGLGQAGSAGSGDAAGSAGSAGSGDAADSAGLRAGLTATEEADVLAAWHRR